MQNQCPYYHNENRNEVCPHFLRGYCKFDMKCIFSHDDSLKKKINFSETAKCEAADESCCICLDSNISYCPIPCGHYKFCFECIKTLKTCAFCQSPMQGFMRIYK